jgi:hypothetical protein
MSDITSSIFSTESGVLPNTPCNSVFPHHNKNRFSDDPNATVEILKKFTETYQNHSGSHNRTS